MYMPFFAVLGVFIFCSSLRNLAELTFPNLAALNALRVLKSLAAFYFLLIYFFLDFFQAFSL